MTKETSFPREKIKVLLLEGVHPAAVRRFEESGYSVEQVSRALSPDELARRVADVHVLGIRSKTEVRSETLSRARHLLAVGCFCIGTNQVDLDHAASAGIPVFNAPFSNTRSVAELTVAEIVMLARRADHKSRLLHRGVWEKSSAGCHEVRQKRVGIVGYGHIGPQVGLLAEAFGMSVSFYDVVPKLPLGNAVQLGSLEELLSTADFVTLHVPETPETRGMMGEREFALMKQGAHFLNLSRGSVVDVPALAAALRSGKLAGAAIDVFPEEPKSNDEPFSSELLGLDNVILTPHVGGSTDEAQHNIGLETSGSLLRFLETGGTTGAVNFARVELPVVSDSHRILNIHRNVPGVLRELNNIIAASGANITAQYLGTKDDIGYLITDVDGSVSRDVKEEFDRLPTTVRTRLLF